MKLFLLMILLTGYFTSSAQFKIKECVSGDCTNGTGAASTDLGRVYRGTFKNGQPEGTGVIVNASYYGETPEYVGEFKNGRFHGKGTVVYKQNKEYEEGMYANGIMVTGTIYFETGKKASITSVKNIKTGLLYTGKLTGNDGKEMAFTDMDFERLQETAYNDGNIARNPRLMEELATDLKAISNMFKEKFDKVDALLATYTDLLACLPDNLPCAELSAGSMERQYQLYSYSEATALDERVSRISRNLLDYRTRPGTSAQDKKDAAMIVEMIDRINTRDLAGPQRSVAEGMKKAFTAMQNSYGRGDISVIKSNFPFEKNAIKQQREKDWDAWTLLTQKF
jgi:hypothetical protein